MKRLFTSCFQSYFCNITSKISKIPILGRDNSERRICLVNSSGSKTRTEFAERFPVTVLVIAGTSICTVFVFVFSRGRNLFFVVVSAPRNHDFRPDSLFPQVGLAGKTEKKKEDKIKRVLCIFSEFHEGCDFLVLNPAEN